MALEPGESGGEDNGETSNSCFLLGIMEGDVQNSQNISRSTDARTLELQPAAVPEQEQTEGEHPRLLARWTEVGAAAALWLPLAATMCFCLRALCQTLLRTNHRGRVGARVCVCV